MFKANSGARIVITPSSLGSSRVWLEIPLPYSGIGENVIEVSVEAKDLEAAFERWAADKARVVSHA